MFAKTRCNSINQSRYLLAVSAFLVAATLSSTILGQFGAVKLAVEAKDEKELTNEQIVARHGKYDILNVVGPFKKAAEPLGKVVKLKWLGERLVFNLPKNYRDAQPFMAEVHKAAGGGGGGTGNEKYWAQYFYGRELSGVINRGTYPYSGRLSDEEKSKADRFRVWVMEITKRGRELLVHGEDLTDFHILIIGGLDPYVFHMRQEKSGVVLVQEVTPEKVFTGKGLTFEKFCREHPEFVQKRLLPLLKNHGIAGPADPFNPLVRQMVIGTINGADDAREKQFAEEFADIDSADFAMREAATKLMDEKFEEWKDTILRLKDDPRFSFEARMRMSRIYKSKCSPEELASIAESSKRVPKVQDPGYLLWLARQENDSAVKEKILAQLASVTKQSLGNDLNAWQDWYTSTPEYKTNANVTVKHSPLSSENGLIKRIATQISFLVRPKLTDGKLELDREHWSRHFGGKTVKQLVAEVKKDIEAKHLPSKWFNASASHVKPEVEYAQVLFDKIRYATPNDVASPYYSSSNMFSYRYSSLNRHFEIPALLAMMDLQPTRDPNHRGSVSNDPQLFRLCLRERCQRLQALTFYETKEKGVQIMIVGQKANHMISFNQEPGGKCVWHDVRGVESDTFQAENFAALYRKNKKYFDTTGYPTLAAFGLSIADAGAEPDGKSTEPATGKEATPTVRPVPLPRISVPRAIVPE